MFIFWKQSLWDLHPLRAISAWMCWWGCVWLACVGSSSSVSDFPFTTAPPLGFWKEHSVLAKGYEQPWQPEPALHAQSFVQGNWKINFLKGETWNTCEETRKITDRGKGRSKGKRNNQGNVKKKRRKAFFPKQKDAEGAGSSFQATLLWVELTGGLKHLSYPYLLINYSALVMNVNVQERIWISVHHVLVWTIQALW